MQFLTSIHCSWNTSSLIYNLEYLPSTTIHWFSKGFSIFPRYHHMVALYCWWRLSTYPLARTSSADLQQLYQRNAFSQIVEVWNDNCQFLIQVSSVYSCRSTLAVYVHVNFSSKCPLPSHSLCHQCLSTWYPPQDVQDNSRKYTCGSKTILTIENRTK
jgi:hypothetical protein